MTSIEKAIQDVIDGGQNDFAAQAIRDARRQQYIDRNAATRLTNYLAKHRLEQRQQLKKLTEMSKEAGLYG